MELQIVCQCKKVHNVFVEENKSKVETIKCKCGKTIEVIWYGNGYRANFK